MSNPADVADLAHDTFFRVIQYQQFDSQAAPIREPRGFLATIASGLVVDLHRRRALERAFLETLAAMPQSYAPSPEEQAVWLQALQQVDAMLDGLGGRIKQTFILSQYDGLTYAQIAEQTGLSLRTVNNHMASAMAHCCRLQTEWAPG